jgi:hypothetical protein
MIPFLLFNLAEGSYNPTANSVQGGSTFAFRDGTTSPARFAPSRRMAARRDAEPVTPPWVAGRIRLRLRGLSHYGGVERRKDGTPLLLSRQRCIEAGSIRVSNGFAGHCATTRPPTSPSTGPAAPASACSTAQETPDGVAGPGGFGFHSINFVYHVSSSVLLSYSSG